MGRGNSGHFNKLDSKEVLFSSKLISKALKIEKKREVVYPALTGEPALPIEKHNPNFDWSEYKNKANIIRLNQEPVQVQAPKHFIESLKEIKQDHPAYYTVCNSCQTMHPCEDKIDRDQFLNNNQCAISYCPGDKGPRFAFDFYSIKELERKIRKDYSAWRRTQDLFAREGAPPLKIIKFELKLKNFYAYNTSTIRQANQENKGKINYTDYTNFIDQEITADVRFNPFSTDPLGYLKGISFKIEEDYFLLPLYEVDFID